MQMCSGSIGEPWDVEYMNSLSICECIAHDIEEIVKRGNLLNERQCQELSSKLLRTVENIRAVKDNVIGTPRRLFACGLRILYPSFVRAKSLVSECAEKDWTAVLVFQVQNESSFREILREVRMCYDLIIRHRLFCIIHIRSIPEDTVKELRSSSWLEPPSVSAIESDQEDLRRRLESLASDPSRVKLFGYYFRKQDAQKQYLGRHLLKKFSCTSQECLSNFSTVCEAGLWKKEMEPPGTWGNSTYLGSGSGASGVCRTRWLGVPCARKEFHGQGSEVTFLKEASILSHLKHPHIVNFICCGNGEAKGDRFIAMELMEKSLFDVIKERKGEHFALPVAVDIIFQIAQGMFYLHGQGVAHRDLKPLNVVVNCLPFTDPVYQYYCVKLVDFGMSKTKVEVSKSDTISSPGVGTTRYRAPEVHPNAHPDGLGKANWFRVDVYSFAMTCVHVLSLKAPFEDMEQLSDLYASLLKGERPWLPPDLPGALVDMLRECGDGNPLLRPSFGDIRRRLSSFRFELLGGNVNSDFYHSSVWEHYTNKDNEAKSNGESLGFELSGGNVNPDLFHSSVSEHSTKKDNRAKRNGEGMGNSKMSSSLASGQTSYCTAHTHFS